MDTSKRGINTEMQVMSIRLEPELKKRLRKVSGELHLTSYHPATHTPSNPNEPAAFHTWETDACTEGICP